VPGRKPTLSTFRSRTSTSRITTVLSAGAFALAVIAATGGLSASAVAQPVSPARASGTAAVATSSAASLIASQKELTAWQAGTATTASHLGWKQEIAWRMMHRRFHWRSRYQFRYLNDLWIRESSWNVHAYNPYSGAYGIPQAVPGSKMASAGPDWQNSARTQIRWGLGYIKARYGTPHRAWRHECTYGWY
jgi:hypothetical protein